MSDCRACHKTMKTIENIAFNRLLILIERKWKIEKSFYMDKIVGRLLAATPTTVFSHVSKSLELVNLSPAPEDITNLNNNVPQKLQ